MKLSEIRTQADADQYATENGYVAARLFEIVSGKLAVTDPCYAAGDEPLKGFANLDIQLVNLPAKNGLWVALALDNREESVEDYLLRVCHVEHEDYEWLPVTYGECIGVDTGRVVVGDQQELRGQEDPDWFETTTHGESVLHGFRGGVSMRTANGDGSFDANAYSDGGLVVAVEVILTDEVEGDEGDE